MSRLEEEFIMGVVRNRSGIDSGEIDYQYKYARFERMSVGCLEDAIRELDKLKKMCEERIEELVKNEVKAVYD